MMMKDNLLKLIKNTRKYKNIQKKVREDIDIEAKKKNDHIHFSVIYLCFRKRKGKVNSKDERKR